MANAKDGECSAVTADSSAFKHTIVWYFIGSAAVFYISNEENRQGLASAWFFALLFALIIPLPHALIACAFKTKRNKMSLLRIYRGWYIALFVFLIVTSIATLFNTIALEEYSNMGYEAPQEEKKSELESGEVLVIHSKESNDQYSGAIIDIELIELLEKKYRDSFLKGQAELYKSKGFSSKAIPKVTNNRFSSIDIFSAPVGAATVWLKSQTTTGEAKMKYIFVAGIIGDTLHKIICSQLTGDDIFLMVNPKCQDKLKEVFGAIN